ncbi:AGC/AKT protein kinase, variant [Phytophthora nicotianae]|uniref:AGC/AKT protein kinase n=1 Tax=Phytophthora nicotianae TaxID=4792 RepID=W2L755_PHYNI|nr:AGC/AKT protein kinase [Phytophthora nicotianae]ETL92609.1 AGC/AKT protein kinase, variant [Phytophthora nicotianae]
MSFRFPRWGRKKSKSKEPVGGNKYYPNGANGAGGVPRGPPSAPGRTYSNGSDYQSQQSWQANGTMPPAPASADYQHSGQRAAAPSANRGVALPFSHPLYAMDAEGMIHLKATGKGLDDSDLAVHQDEIINTVVKYVQDSMRKELGFKEVYIPANSTPEAPVKANVFVSRNYETCKKLLVFVAVSRGLYPGLWSRGLVLHAGVKSGSMLEYFRKAIDEGYGIIVANPNKNVIVMRDGKQRLQIPGSSSPEEHMDSLWDSYVARSAARRVYFLGYSYGGVLIKYLLQSRGDQLMRRNGAIALIESSHRIEDGDSQSVKSILAHRTMYWESNDQLFQTKLDGDAPHRTGCTCLSAGRPPRAHANHYYVTAFCINKIQDALFRFLDTRDATTYVVGEKPVPEPPASAPAFMGNGAAPTAPQLARQESTRREANNSKMGNSEKHCNLCLFHFTLFDRRHHCRMCHRAVCNACSRDRLFLPGSSTAQRVCTECATEGPRANNQPPTQPLPSYPRINRTASDAVATTNSSADMSQARNRSDTQMSNQGRSESNAQPPQNTKLSVEDFDLLKVIGKGAFGKVMLVRKKVPDGSSNPNAIYAMKVLKKASVFAKNQVEHTKSERRILRDIDHPFVVRLRYAFQNEDKLYLVMDYYNGGSLFFHLRKSRKFSEKRARFYAAQLLMSMSHLHELNIAYRDLKLENILMDDKGFIALTDFGLSKENVDVPDGAKTFCGTAEYIAPELLKGLPYGKAVDWWGFGTLLYEMMTGQTPFFDRNRKRMFHNILHRDVVFTQAFSEDAKDLLTGLLRRDPAKRLGSGPSGVQEIMDHPFFASIDFDKLLKREVEPPFKPVVNSEADTGNVANIFTREMARDSPVTQELGATHRAQAHFDGFTYMPGNEHLN